MPWGLILRLGTTLLTIIGYRRLQRGELGVVPTPASLRKTFRGARDTASILSRVAAATIGAAFAVVAVTAAITLAGPGPHWLAAVFGLAAVVAGAGVVVETARARRQVRLLREQRSMRAAIRALDRDPDTGAAKS